MSTVRTKRPKTLQDFEARFPAAWRSYRGLREACDHSGPLDAKTRELIKIGIEVARKRHGGLIAHIDRAKAAGASAKEIAHAILLALPLIGLPDVLDAFVTAKKRLH
jgi:AhpD family alkylhydroperoxidase